MPEPSRFLFVIPHYFAPEEGSNLGSQRDPRGARARVLGRTLEGLRETFGGALQVQVNHRSVASVRNVVDIVIVTTGPHHLMAHIGETAGLAEQIDAAVEPSELGFAAHRVLAEAVGAYDHFGFVEDDILIHDPMFFLKQRWFSNEFGSDAVLQPNRFEASGGLKVYPDGPLGREATAGLAQPPGPERLAGRWFGIDVEFVRPSNPHGGCFFLDRDQMAHLAAHPRFGVPHSSFVRTLETAASGPLAESFRVYKPAAPMGVFLEVEHQGSHYLSLWGASNPRHIVEALRDAAEAECEATRVELAALLESNSWRLTAPIRRVTHRLRRVQHRRRSIV